MNPNQNDNNNNNNNHNDNRIQKRRKRRRKAASSSLLFVIALSCFADQICDIQSTPIQQEATSDELSAPTQTPADNQQSEAASGQERILLEPQDTAAIVGQPTDLSCILAQPNAPVWFRNGMAISRGLEVIGPFSRRFSLPAAVGANDDGQPGRRAPINYTMHISRVSMADDGVTFVCVPGLTGLRSRPAKLSVWQPPTRVHTIARIEEQSTDSQAGPLLASVMSGKQLLWFDHQHRPVQETFSVSGGAANSIWDGISAGPSESSEPESARRQLADSEGSALIWSFNVQKHHHDHILTCQADHPAFQDAGKFPSLFGRQPRHRVRLEVQFLPEVTLTKEPAQAQEHQPIRFRCEARSRPNPLVYRWYIDGQLVANATSAELQISRVTRQLNQREIRCQVSNEVGSQSDRLQLSVHYSPAFVSHLLPVSLQPHYQAAQEWNSAPANSRQQQSGQLRWRRHQLALARQLAIGAEPNQDVELRCDFDANPRVHSVQWYKLATEYSIMGNVTPAESDDLIQRGALYAYFRYTGEHSADLVRQEVDYERMSADELELLDAESSFGATSNSTQVPLLEPLAGQPPTMTRPVVFEPLEWTVSQEPPMSLDPETNLRHRSLPLPLPSQQKQHQHQQQLQQLPQQPTITTVSLSSRSFDSGELESSSVNDKLNWRLAEVASSKLVLRQVNVDSVGKYVCRAKASPAEGGLQQQHLLARAVYLVLREKPRIISHPMQVAHLGQRQISVECLAQINTVADNSTQIQWFKDGKLIEESSDDKILAPTAADNSATSRNISIIVERSPDLLFMRSRLRIGAPTYADFGLYNCTIVNSNGVPDSMAINLQPTATTTGLIFRTIAAIGILSICVLGCTITCLLAFAPQRGKLAAKEQAKVKSLDSKAFGADQLDSPPTTATSSTHESDTDSLRKSQASSDQPTTLSEAPAIDDPSAHLCSADTNGAHMLAHERQQLQQAPCHYMQLSEQPYLSPYSRQRQMSQSNQMIYSRQQPMANGWSPSNQATNGHYQMPSNVAAPGSMHQPPPLPPPPPQVGMSTTTTIVESPYVANGRTYYHSTAANGVQQDGSGYAAALNSSQMMVANDGEAQFESQYGSMISNAYRALGYSTTSSPSSGGSTSSGPVHPVSAVLSIGGQQQLHHHHSTGSASSSPNSLTTYHNVQSGSYISQLSLQRQQKLNSLQPQQHSSPGSDILLMKTSDISDSAQNLHGPEVHGYIAATTTTDGTNNNGLATHV